MSSLTKLSIIKKKTITHDIFLLMIFFIVVCADGPVNGFVKVISSKKITPSAQMSLSEEGLINK
jgi:hypothetical protein